MGKELCPHCERFLLETDAPPGSQIVLPRCPGCGKRARVVCGQPAPQPPLDKRPVTLLR